MLIIPKKHLVSNVKTRLRYNIWQGNRMQYVEHISKETINTQANLKHCDVHNNSMHRLTLLPQMEQLLIR